MGNEILETEFYTVRAWSNSVLRNLSSMPSRDFNKRLLANVGTSALSLSFPTTSNKKGCSGDKLERRWLASCRFAPRGVSFQLATL